MTDRDIGFVQKLSDRNLEDRAMHHRWYRRYFGRLGNSGIQAPYSPSVIVRQSFCDSCGTTREEFFNPPQGDKAMRGYSFVPFARRYHYNKDYLWKGKESSKERPYIGDYNYELLLRTTREGPNGRR